MSQTCETRLPALRSSSATGVSAPGSQDGAGRLRKERKRSVFLGVGGGAMLLLTTHPLQAQPLDGSGSSAPAIPTWPAPAHQGPVLVAFPQTTLYPRYLADPRQMMMKGMVLGVLKSDIEKTRSPLFEFTMGGWARLLRLHPTGEPELGLQLSAGAAFIGRFDPKENYDAIGWDGFYSMRLEYRPFYSLTFKLADQHDSGHVADEYIRKTGRKRLTYTREEVALGVVYSLPLSIPLRVYAEAGYAVHLGNKHLRPWRNQTGLEVELANTYLATDINFWEESGYAPTTTVQVGIKSEPIGSGRRYGLAVQFENGRTVLGEFYKSKNRTFGAGFWADL